VRVAITDLFPDHWRSSIHAVVPPGWDVGIAEGVSEEERARLVAPADIVLAGSAPPTDQMIRDAPRLRFLQKLGAGYDNVNLELCREKGITVARLNGNNSVAVAEHTVLLMLSALRRLPYIDSRVRQGEWSKQLARASNRELRGKTVGLIGFGRIGREVARRLTGFEVDVVYYDPVSASPSDERQLGVRPVSIDDLIAQSDIVCLHLPLTAESRHLMDASRIAAMKPRAILVNCSRGELVDEDALAQALESGHFGGAGLDCVTHEQPGGPGAFANFENVTLTCHIAGVSEENFVSMMARAFSNAAAFVEGRPLPPEDIVLIP
jgi:D-3-phosphoglycerate dehydrogenase / 2-oxoglutarate reductase